ncbi:hypothetical protein CO656_13130 [Sinorhizobium sp. FG01]|uniref:Uncharacterized protein n=1 Tax=Sinorhizobium americanum TaxID=194963 RepID=A0A2S3YIJ0_9HYPH|nr:hypothetical protein CO656_13130 [Sinorhizobium sp. FG01]POH26815.1 hypothetical protein ATY31_22930 [Sinorhizobium americanum]
MAIPIPGIEAAKMQFWSKFFSCSRVLDSESFEPVASSDAGKRALEKREARASSTDSAYGAIRLDVVYM